MKEAVVSKKEYFVRNPAMLNGVWCVVVAESASPLAKVIEVVPCGSRDGALQTYRRVKKEQGEWL